MRYGMNMLLWTTHVTSEHFPVIEKLKKTGFDGIEIPIFDGDVAHYQSIRKELDKQGLAATTVAIMTPEANPISPEASVRRAAVERLKWVLDMTAAIGSELVCGPYHSPLGVFTGTGPTDTEKKHCAESLRQGAEYAGKNKVRIAIE